MDASTIPATDPSTAPQEPNPSFTLSTTNTTLDTFNLARKKHEDRAKRFGVEYIEPKQEVVNVNGPKRYVNPKKSGFVTGFSLNDEEEKKKRELRAKKFAIEGTATETPPAPVDDISNNNGVEAAQADDAMDSGMDVDLREERKDVGIDVQRRLDTIYLYGTDDMSTEDVFKYFKDYGSSSVEWINDSSCNVIFDDVHTATRALQGLSKPMDAFNLQITSDKLVTTTPNPSDPTPAAQVTTDPSAPQDSAVQPQPPQPPTPTVVQATPEQITLYGWRKGVSVKGVPMLMRYATVADVKSKESKPSAYYKRMLAQLRAKAQQKRKQNNNKNRKRKNKNRNKSANTGDNESRPAKRRLDDGDVEMLDPAEQEKRLQRRRRFYPESDTTETDSSTYVVSSSTVSGLLQETAPQV